MPIVKENTVSNVSSYGPKPRVAAGPASPTMSQMPQMPRFVAPVSGAMGDALMAKARTLGHAISLEEQSRRSKINEINSKYKDRIDGINSVIKIAGGVGLVIDRALERRAKLEVDQFKGEFREFMNRATQGGIDDNGQYVQGTYQTPYSFAGEGEQEATGPYVATAKKLTEFKNSDAYNNLSARAKEYISSQWDSLADEYLRKASHMQEDQFKKHRELIKLKKVDTAKANLASHLSPKDIAGGIYNNLLKNFADESVGDYMIDNGLAVKEGDGLKYLDTLHGTSQEAEVYAAALKKEIVRKGTLDAVNALTKSYIAENNDEAAEGLSAAITNYVQANFENNSQQKEDVLDSLKDIVVKRNERIAKDINTRESECDAMIAKAILTNQDQEQAIKSVTDRLNQDELIPSERVTQVIDKYRNQFLMDEYVDLMEKANKGGANNLTEVQDAITKNPALKKLFDSNNNNNNNKKKEATPTNAAAKLVKITDNNWINGHLFADKPLKDKLSALDDAYNNNQMSEKVYKKNKENLVRNARYELACDYDKGTIKKDHQEIWSALQTICGFDVKDWFEYDDLLSRPKVDENGRFILKERKKGKRIQSGISSAGEIMTFGEKFVAITTDGWRGELPSFVTITGEALQEIINGCQDYLIAQRLGHPNTYDGTTNIETRQFVPDKDKPIPLLDYIKSNLSGQTQAIDNAIIQRSLFDFETYLNSGAF